MKVSDCFIPTLREVPAEAEIPSHQLLLRAGFIRKLGAGIYTYLPLAWRVIGKIEALLKDEMDSIGCGEIRMPTLHPQELLEETNRWDVDVVYKLKDRREASFALGFTHEEVITDIARRDFRSWRDLPRLLYQVQTKFRDEPRPRGGLIRTREFIMYDAYSFDRDDAGMELSFQKFKTAYSRVFNRMGLPFVIAEADGGAIGDLDNNEFVVLSPSGEDTILICRETGYAANVECCPVLPPDPADAPIATNGNGNGNGDKPLEIVSTPGARTIDEVAGMLGTAPMHLVKTLIYLADGAPVAALVRGDHEVNEVKLRRLLNVAELFLADDTTVERITGAPTGFAGPVGLIGPRVIADHALSVMRNFITGANQADAHYVHVNVGRDFAPTEFADLRNALPGDPSPDDSRYLLTEARGIEVGHVFKLGTKYSAAMNATFTDENSHLQTIQMGSYGIGLGRTMAAAIEISHDGNGIIWHPAIAPFQVVIVVADWRDPAGLESGQALHDALEIRGIDALLDDRDERAGVKFKDADLVGYPVRVVVGKGLANGFLEIRARRDAASSREVPVLEAADAIAALLIELRDGPSEQQAAAA
ncbi:MAG: proline--tRNA ligase [Cytophagales bacterium]|nr:proline--tRNA ligase [Armatimonadota bacterium]